MKSFERVLLVLLAVTTLPHAAFGATIQGRVLDTESRTPVYRTEVTLLGTAAQATSDRDGAFRLVDVPAGTYTIQATRLGYEDLVLTGQRVATDDSLTLDLAMTRSYVPLEEVTVTPGSYSFMDEGTASRQTMSREDIESAPQLAEDLFRAVNRLPGLASGDYAAHFGIRGGRHDETLIRLDGLELYEPYHLKDFEEGAISIIDAETVEGVQLMTGGFPAKYGDKRSGVFDITSRNVELDKTQYSLGASLMNARAMGRGPLWDGKGSWLVSARSGWMDLVFKMISQDELPSPRYHDVFGKFQVDLTPNHILSFDGLYAGDSYKYDTKSTTGFADSINSREFANNHYTNSYLWTNLQSTLGDRTFVRTQLSAGLVTRDRDGYEVIVATGDSLYSIDNQRDFSNVTFMQDWTQGITRNLSLAFGIDARYFDNKDNYKSLVNRDPNDPEADSTNVYPIVTYTNVATHGKRLSLYLSAKVRPWDPLTFELGGRYDKATWTGDEDFSPRTSASLALGGGRALRASWGYYRQIQGLDDVDALNGVAYYKSELTEQYSAGFEQTFRKGSFARIEGYYKKGSELRPTYRNWKGGIDTFPESNEDRILVLPVSNDIKGVEVFVDHAFNERMATRASYSYSVGEETVSSMTNVNSDYPLSYDKTHRLPTNQVHAANVDFTYRFRQKWSATGALVYHTGWPGTDEELVYVTDDNDNPDAPAIRPKKIYGFDLPDYFRIDVRATRRWQMRGGEMRFFVEIINLTNHANVFGYDNLVGGVDPNLSPPRNYVMERQEETWFTILPSLGIAWTSSF